MRHNSTTPDLAADSPLSYAQIRELNSRRELAPALAQMTPRERIGVAAVLAEHTGRDVSAVQALVARLMDEAGATPPPVARARAKAEYHLAGGLEIRISRDGSALVPSGTRGGIVHRVIDGRCTCEAGQVGRPCWHVAAVELAA
jgi:hypothetical protein